MPHGDRDHARLGRGRIPNKKIQSFPRAAVLQIKKRVDNNNEELEIRLRLLPGLLQFKSYLV
jgi:hypothetical protein